MKLNHCTQVYTEYTRAAALGFLFQVVCQYWSICGALVYIAQLLSTLVIVDTPLQWHWRMEQCSRRNETHISIRKCSCLGSSSNNSLYVCEKPCTECWQYVGGSFKQVDGGNNVVYVIGVTTDNALVKAAATSVIIERNRCTLPMHVHSKHHV